MESLYVLQLEDNKWYVGKSTDIANRFKQHQSGSGSAWTKSYKPVKIVETRRLKDQYDETNTTKEYMKKYGIENVRGGAYTQIVLPDYAEKALKQELRGDTDACFKCNLKGHFANKCPGRVAHVQEDVEYECANCNRTFTTEYGCRVHQRSCDVKTMWECDFCPKQFKTESACHKHEENCGGQIGTRPTISGTCYRCGRQGHYSPDCYAIRHIKGYELD